MMLKPMKYEYEVFQDGERLAGFWLESDAEAFLELLKDSFPQARDDFTIRPVQED